MSTMDRILTVVSHWARLQARYAARDVDRTASVLLLKLTAGCFAVASLVVWLVALYVALSQVMSAAAALAIVGILPALLAAGLLLAAATLRHQDTPH